ncbi:MAG: hypothetical protein KA795_01785 [Burkholderiaceae bacterium]|nr:hypothetical protein [Burkholderiaceae bacterium]
MRALASSRPASALLVAGALAAMLGWWFDGALPARARLDPSTATEPLQTPTAQHAVFTAQRGGVDYTVRPVADYDITGLVVSMHHADAWWDWIHAASADHLNVVDLCVVWGANAADGAYERMKFSSGQFVCYVSTRDSSAWQPQYIRALSNNHLLTDDARIARQLAGVRIGDQIRVRGQLVEYSHNHGFAFTRGTSVTRDDQGNGACETIFVRDVQVLRSASSWPRWLMWVGLLAMVLGVVLWFRAPHVPHED